MTRLVLSPTSAAERDLAPPTTPSRRWIWVLVAFVAVAAGIVAFAPAREFPETIWVDQTLSGDGDSGHVRTTPEGPNLRFRVWWTCDHETIFISEQRADWLELAVETFGLRARRLDRSYSATGVERTDGDSQWTEYTRFDPALR
ncbi:MAG: hypothetical protein K8T90_21720 [Planctomycetes bacterium]|nr:hypothetical protein [Planctomycetota bacterium]